MLWSLARDDLVKESEQVGHTGPCEHVSDTLGLESLVTIWEMHIEEQEAGS